MSSFVPFDGFSLTQPVKMEMHDEDNATRRLRTCRSDRGSLCMGGREGVGPRRSEATIVLIAELLGVSLSLSENSEARAATYAWCCSSNCRCSDISK
jgi:hypothetical protein